MSFLPGLFGSLSDPTRFAIVERLLKEGELNAGTLQDGFDISAPAISRHLNVLTKAGVLNRRTAGQQRLYSVRPQSIEAICAWTMSHRDFWQTSLDRLEKALLKEMEKK